MAVYFDNFLDRGGFEEWTGYALFYADYNTIAGSYLEGWVSWTCIAGVGFGGGGTSYSDGGGAELDCLKGVFDLKETTLGREGAGLRLVLRLQLE